jgi:hypothetical protein
VIYGLLGLDASSGYELAIKPNLPKACEKMGVSNILYHNVRMNLQIEDGAVTLNIKDTPESPIRILLDGKWSLDEGAQTASQFMLSTPGVYAFKRQ